MIIPILHLLFLVSGFCGMGSQLVCTRLLSLGLGQEWPAVLAVITAFFLGLAIGGWGARNLDASRAGKACLLLYAMLEATIGVWQFILPSLMHAIQLKAPGLIGAAPSALWHWSVAFTIPAVTLLPATVAMGASLPVMELAARGLSEASSRLGSLYAANTLGASLGIVSGAAFMVERLGLSHSLYFLGSLNLACALVAILAARQDRGRIAASKPFSGKGVEPGTNARAGGAQTAVLSAGRLRISLLATGVLGLGIEVLGGRYLSLILQGTILTYATLLLVYLAMTALGASAMHVAMRRFQPFDARVVLGWLLAGTALAFAAGLTAFPWTAGWFASSQPSELNAGAPWLRWTRELLVAGSILALPCLLMGATFTLLARDGLVGGTSLGAMTAWNSLGGTLGTPLIALVLIPVAGLKAAAAILVASYLLLVPALKRMAWVGALLTLALIPSLPGSREMLRLPPGWSVLSAKDGIAESVAVLQDPLSEKVLQTNGRFSMGGTASAAAERRHAHIPLLLHPAPRTALFLGLGTGITAGAGLSHPGLRITGVDLSPEILGALSEFAAQNRLESWTNRLDPVLADARRFVRATTNSYDVIVADLFHPSRDGVGFLYTVEHFQAIRARLNHGGLFCQWLPLYQFDTESLRIVVRSFLIAFPNATCWLLRPNTDTPVLGLIGTVDAPGWNHDWLEKRAVPTDLGEAVNPLAQSDGIHLFGLCFGGSDGLARFAGTGPLNSDDRPVVIFTTARAALHPQPATVQTIKSVLGGMAIAGVEPLGASSGNESYRTRLPQYREALLSHLDGLDREAARDSDGAFEGFLRAATTSADFSLAYAQCLSMAMRHSTSDPAKAMRWLEKLAAARPESPVAERLLERLKAESH